MIDVSWLVFIPAAILLIIVPGQDMMLVMSRSVAQGSKAGVLTAAGVSIGLIGHSILAALGLGLIVRTSEWLFFAIKLVGAAYLIYLGISFLRANHKELVVSGGVARSPSRLFFDGMFSNMANPKIAVFYLAFLPQFVSSSASHPTFSMFVLGLLFAGLTFLVKGPVAVASGSLSQWLRTHPNGLIWVYRTSGAVLIGLALKLAFERRAAV